MTTYSPTPEYEDTVQVANKITFAPKTEREVTILLADHVGREGRRKDAEIISFMSSLSEDMNELELMAKFADDDQFLHILSLACDLDDEEGQTILEKSTLFDLALAFRKAISFRTGQIQREDVNTAEKK